MFKRYLLAYANGHNRAHYEFYKNSKNNKRRGGGKQYDADSLAAIAFFNWLLCVHVNLF